MGSSGKTPRHACFDAHRAFLCFDSWSFICCSSSSSRVDDQAQGGEAHDAPSTQEDQPERQEAWRNEGVPRPEEGARERTAGAHGGGEVNKTTYYDVTTTIQPL